MLCSFIISSESIALQISGLQLFAVAWNRLPIKKLLLDWNASPLWRVLLEHGCVQIQMIAMLWRKAQSTDFSKECWKLCALNFFREFFIQALNLTCLFQLNRLKLLLFLQSTAVLPSAFTLGIVSYVGCSLSIIGLVITIWVYTAVWYDWTSIYNII